MSLIRRFAIMVGLFGALGIGLALAAGFFLSALRIGALTEDLRSELDHVAAVQMRAGGEAALDRFAHELREPLAAQDRAAIQTLAARLRDLSGLVALRVYDPEGRFVADSEGRAEAPDLPAAALTAAPEGDKARWRDEETLLSGSPVLLGATTIGHVVAVMDGWRLEVRRQTLEEQIVSAEYDYYLRSITITLTSLLVGALIAGITGALLGRRLGLDVDHVIKALHGMVSGGYTPPELREEEMRKLGDQLSEVADILTGAREDADEVLESLDDGVLVLTQDGEVLRANGPAHKMLELEEGALTGRQAAALLGVEAEGGGDELIGALASLTELTDSKGERVPVIVSAKSHQREGEEEARIVVMLRDGAELEQREIALSEALTRAAQAEKAKSAFLSVMNHELKTPLHGILGGASILKAEQLSEDQQDFVKMIEDSGKSLLNVVDGVIKYTRLESGDEELDLAPAQLDEIGQSIAGAVAADAAAKGLDLVVRVAPDAPPVNVDREKLIELGKQMAENAVKFTEEGHVVIDLDFEEIDGEPQVKLEVRDTGPGIPQEKQEELFALFHQGEGDIDRDKGGFGLGLSIMKKTADLLGGEIGIESEPGQGSTFRFLARGEAAGDPPPAITPLEGKSALVVSENAALGDSLSEKLAHGGADVRYASSVEEAEALYKERPADIIAASERLEGLAGSELAELMSDPGDGEPAKGILLRAPGAAPPPEAPIAEGAQVAPSHAGAATLIAAAAQAAGVPESEYKVRPEQDWEEPGEYKVRDERIAPRKKTPDVKNVILADPSDVSRVVLSSFIRKKGLKCHMASNGFEALKLFKTLRPSLIIMDVTMPVMNGLEATRGVRRLEQENHLRATPIIGLAATDRDTELERCLQAGMTDTLVKPVKLKELEAKVARWTEDEQEPSEPKQAAG